MSNPSHIWNLSDSHFYYQLKKTLCFYMAHVIRLLLLLLLSRFSRV